MDIQRLRQATVSGLLDFISEARDETSVVK